MKPIGWRRKTGIAAMLLGCALVFARCDAGPLAGSSVTTGNPTEIQVSFTDENGPVALAGRVDVYGSTQVPVPGFDSEPLASVEVSGQKDVILKPGHFTAIPDTMWPEGSLEGDSLAHFNLVITGDGKGAILRDMTWRRKAGEFILGSIYTQARKQKAESRLEAGLTPLT